MNKSNKCLFAISYSHTPTHKNLSNSSQEDLPNKRCNGLFTCFPLSKIIHFLLASKQEQSTKQSKHYLHILYTDIAKHKIHQNMLLLSRNQFTLHEDLT